VTGQSLKQAMAWVLIAILAMTLAATMLALAAPDMAQAVSDTSQKVGDEDKGWLTVLFLVVAGFAALPVIGRLDVAAGLALAALVLRLTRWTTRCGGSPSARCPARTPARRGSRGRATAPGRPTLARSPPALLLDRPEGKQVVPAHAKFLVDAAGPLPVGRRSGT
jgi:hypothetical protein